MEANFSSPGLAALALAGGLFMLVAGGESLVTGASRFALRNGMRPMLVGLTIVAFGTSMPEFFVSLSASFQGHADIMLGNVVGSNIANIGLVLGVSALIRTLPVDFAGIRKELLLVIGVSLLVTWTAFTGYFSRFLGVGLVAGLIWYTIAACRNAAGAEEGAPESGPQSSNFKIGGLIAGGLLLLAYGSNLFIDGAVDLARNFGVSELVVGLTVAAVGTSLPELASSISATVHRHHDILVGNIIGSNLFNLMMVLGGTAALKPFAVGGDLLVRDLPVMIAYVVFLVPVFHFRRQLSRLTGLALLGGYLLYMWGLAG